MSAVIPRAPIRETLRRLRPVFLVVLVLVVAALVVNVVVAVWTNHLWFRSLGDSFVYDRQLTSQVVLFALFGGVTAVAVAANLWLIHRFIPPDEITERQGWLRERYRTLILPRWPWLTALVALVTGLIAGSAAAGQWQLWLLWRNATSFGRRDPVFHRDYSYFTFVYPFHRYVLGIAFWIVGIALVSVIVIAYLHGATRLTGAKRRFRPAVRTHLAVLLGLLALLKAAAYWLDRLATATSSRGVVTGPSYTDLHAVLPDKIALMVIALVMAAVFFANAVYRSGKVMLLGVGVLIVAGIVLGGIVPALVQQFTVKPNAEISEARSIARNIAATRYSYGLDGNQFTTNSTYPGKPTLPAAQLQQQAETGVQAHLLDANQVSPTFTQLQQERSFYGFKSTLDVDRYTVGGKTSDVLIGLRELMLSGLPSSQQTWTNQHLVYTHGNGVVMAPASGVDSQGNPDFVEGGLPSTGVLGDFQSRIYFGQMSPSYSIVGAPPGSTPHELDLPAVNGSDQINNTYAGNGGVSIGSAFDQLAYAWKFRDKNIFFSSEVNKDSRLLYIRDPRQRVQKVAPWLTLDGDAYPVVEGGHIVWVVDGYTTSNSVPYSQQQNLGSATSDTYVVNGSTVAQGNQSVNYIRNSVKATVDAYDGTVTLYQWNPSGGPTDPVLATWMRAFPGLVKPQADIPADMLAHLRYPQDLFNLQRSMLTKYHESDPRAFYNGTDFWKVPLDPSASGSVPQPSYYMQMAPTGTGAPVFSLTTPFVSLSGRNLVAYLAVDSNPGPGYGAFTLLELPTNEAVEGPGQIHNDIESDPTVSQQLTLLRGGGSQVVLGNLQSVPLGGDVLYIEPIYTRAAGGTSFPILRRVVTVYDDSISYQPTYAAALAGAFGNGPATNTTLSDAVAAAQLAFAKAQAALAAGDHKTYIAEEAKLQQALAEIAAASQSP